MSYLVLCPYVHRPTFEGMAVTLDPTLLADAVVLDNTRRNLGAAGSRNVGARRILDEGIDWLVDVSPVTRFGPSAGLDFIDRLDDYPDAWVVQASTPVNWHLMAWSRKLFERVGLFDENFWPINCEDIDMAYRIRVAETDDGRTAVWDCVDVDAWITMYGHSAKVAGIYANHEMLWRYYEAKWGGRSGQERYRRPFNRPDVGLDWWPGPRDPLSIYEEVRA